MKSKIAKAKTSKYPHIDAMTSAKLDDFIDTGDASHDERDYALKLRRRRSKK